MGKLLERNETNHNDGYFGTCLNSIETNIKSSIFALLLLGIKAGEKHQAIEIKWNKVSY